MESFTAALPFASFLEMTAMWSLLQTIQGPEPGADGGHPIMAWPITLYYWILINENFNLVSVPRNQSLEFEIQHFSILSTSESQYVFFSSRRISRVPSWALWRVDTAPGRAPATPAPPSTWRGSSPPPRTTGSPCPRARRWAVSEICQVLPWCSPP